MKEKKWAKSKLHFESREQKNIIENYFIILETDQRNVCISFSDAKEQYKNWKYQRPHLLT